MLGRQIGPLPATVSVVNSPIRRWLSAFGFCATTKVLVPQFFLRTWPSSKAHQSYQAEGSSSVPLDWFGSFGSFVKAEDGGWDARKLRDWDEETNKTQKLTPHPCKLGGSCCHWRFPCITTRKPPRPHLNMECLWFLAVQSHTNFRDLSYMNYQQSSCLHPLQLCQAKENINRPKLTPYSQNFNARPCFLGILTMYSHKANSYMLRVPKCIYNRFECASIKI